MRPNRLKLNHSATYHVMSRSHESRFFFQDVEKSYMHNLMLRMAVVTGCEIRTYAFLDNHFHYYRKIRLDLLNVARSRRECGSERKSTIRFETPLPFVLTTPIRSCGATGLHVNSSIPAHI